MFLSDRTRKPHACSSYTVAVEHGYRFTPTLQCGGDSAAIGRERPLRGRCLLAVLVRSVRPRQARSGLLGADPLAHLVISPLGRTELEKGVNDR